LAHAGTAWRGNQSSATHRLEIRNAGEERGHQEAHQRAENYVALDQFCPWPQCGHASTEEGNVPTEAAQWDKMKMILDISKEVWR
jgi:hypothetical protein